MRVLLAICVVAGCTLCGRSMAGAARRRRELLEQLAGGIARLELQMVDRLEPIRRALQAAGCPLFDEVAGRMDPGGSAMEAWRDVCARERSRRGSIDALTDGDIAALDGLFEGLGESGRDAQRLLLESSEKELRARLESARRQAADTSRLYGSLGFLTGLTLALIVI